VCFTWNTMAHKNFLTWQKNLSCHHPASILFPVGYRNNWEVNWFAWYQILLLNVSTPNSNLNIMVVGYKFFSPFDIMLMNNIMVVGYGAGVWLGILKQLAQHMGPILRILDLSLRRSNIGCLDISCYLPSTS
jgi:hypothetical protein